MEPIYTFTIPSIEDDVVLDCRLYQPEGLSTQLTSSDRRLLRGAVVAHPYAPLGGCYDDPIVLSVTGQLLRQDYVVTTFNFRGAGGSAGSTSWSAKGEKDDYATLVGFIVHYMRGLTGADSVLNAGSPPTHETPASSYELLLAGYSYGSLILTRLTPLQDILNRFNNAVLGTSTAEVVLRARRLAQETLHKSQESDVQTARGREGPASSSPGRQRAHSNTVRIGGEETLPSERRPSRGSHESRRGLDIMKKSVEVPHRIAVHLRRHSSSKSQEEVADEPLDEQKLHLAILAPVKLSYLLISPLLPPLSHALAPPSHVIHLFGQDSSAEDTSTGFGSLEHDTLAVWGTDDGFSSSKKLTAWIEMLQAAAPGHVTGVDIAGAGHFWREQGMLKQLLRTIAKWIDK